MKRHLAPAWMLAGVLIDAKCPDCNAPLRRAENQDLCIPCWERRTAQSLERAARCAAELKRKQMAAAASFTEEESAYRWMVDMAGESGDFVLALDYKWRAVTLETTGWVDSTALRQRKAA